MGGYLRLDFRVHVVVDYANFELCDPISSQKRIKVCETVFACSYGAQVKSFKPKQIVEHLMTLPLSA